ncbi:MAG: flavodoxin family protein [Spirochaetes bacterium]|nr:flavodoxin family protein [Spirochaetota bacterium]
MHVIALNGSPKEHGNTYQALQLVTDELGKNDITSEIIHVGNKAAEGCRACGSCAKTGVCIITDDSVNETADKIDTADGLLIGSPVHYASIAGTLKNYLDRLFYSAGRRMLRHKPAAAVVAVRRSGGMSTFQDINSYFLITEAVVPASNYWNIIHGQKPGEVHGDTEGVQIMRVLGRNMAWMMKLIEHGKGSVSEPEREQKQMMNFIH